MLPLNFALAVDHPFNFDVDPRGEDWFSAESCHASHHHLKCLFRRRPPPQVFARWLSHHFTKWRYVQKLRYLSPITNHKYQYFCQSRPSSNSNRGNVIYIPDFCRIPESQKLNFDEFDGKISSLFEKLYFAIKLRIKYRGLSNLLEECNVYAENIVNLTIIDKVWVISTKICLRFGFSVPGFQLSSPGLNPEEKSPISRSRD
jgi:hypothetical protein